MRLAGVLDDGFKGRNAIFDLENLLQLLMILHHDDVSSAVDRAVETSFRRIGRVDSSNKSAASGTDKNNIL